MNQFRNNSPDDDDDDGWNAFGKDLKLKPPMEQSAMLKARNNAAAAIKGSRELFDSLLRLDASRLVEEEVPLRFLELAFFAMVDFFFFAMVLVGVEGIRGGDFFQRAESVVVFDTKMPISQQISLSER